MIETMIELTPSNIMFTIGIAGTVFTVFQYFNKPQVNLDKADALTQLALKTLQENFTQFQKDFANLRDNHLHSMDLKIDGTNQAVTNLALTVTRLSTIIDERIPKKEVK